MLAHEAIERFRQLDGVELFALHVLDQGKLERLFGAYVLDDHKRFAHASALKGSPPSLACDDLELVRLARCRAYDQRFDQAVLTNALGQLVELASVEVLARLPVLRHDSLEGAQEDALVAKSRRGGRGG